MISIKNKKKKKSKKKEKKKNKSLKKVHLIWIRQKWEYITKKIIEIIASL